MDPGGIGVEVRIQPSEESGRLAEAHFALHVGQRTHLATRLGGGASPLAFSVFQIEGEQNRDDAMNPFGLHFLLEES